MRLSKILIIYVLGLLTFFTNTSVFAQQNKTAVCHITGSYDFGNGASPTGHVITIADPALPQHIEHGDTVEYVMQTLPDGSAVCTTDLDSDGDGVFQDADNCDNPGALQTLLSVGVPFTITSDGCIVLSGTLPWGADLSGINLDGAILSGVNLNGLNITGASLVDADLSFTTGASTGGSSKITADGANLSGANFTNSYLRWSTFINANLSNATFDDAYLGNVDFSGADLSGASFNETWCPDAYITPPSGGSCIGHLDF